LSSCELTSVERRTIERTATIFEFDDQWVAPRNGFEDAADYYTRTAGAQFVRDIAVPTLMLHAANDPWIPIEPYLGLKTLDNPNVELLLAESGGHLGFHERGHADTWHDRRIDRFVQRLVGGEI
ncbi:MAG: YheT family hydrolase, partial [Alphaproteobacteria bacterium]